MKQQSNLQSILNYTCPRCHRGELFSTPFSLKNAYNMYSRCPVCNLNYVPEPGYYYGAMFISYILTGWLFIIIGLVLVFGLNWTFLWAIGAVLVLTILIHNQIFRLSRSIWLHFFVKFDPTIQKKVNP